MSYYGPDGSENTIEAELVILAPFIYDNARLLLLSKTEKFPNGLANSSGHLGKHMIAHIMARVFAAFDDRYVNVYMGPSAQKHASTISTPTISIIPAWVLFAARRFPLRPPTSKPAHRHGHGHEPPPGMPRWGAEYRDFLAKYFTRYAAIVAQTENLPYADQTIDLDPNVRDQWGLPAPRVTYDWSRPNEMARTNSCWRSGRIGRAMGAKHSVARSRSATACPARIMKAARAWAAIRKLPWSIATDRPGISRICSCMGSSTHPTMSGFNPTLTIQALAYMTADAIVNRYKKSPGHWCRPE